MNGHVVGHWSVASGEHRFDYDVAWLASADARHLSLSLPLTFRGDSHRGPAVEAWFDNLLPDDPLMRGRLRQAFGARSTRAFDLLAETGRDCVGAVQILPDGIEPSAPAQASGLPLDEAAVARILRARAAGVMLPGDRLPGDFRLSLAGAQEKTALLRLDGRWHEPRDTTPTTHILKLPLGRTGADGIDLAGSVENEWLCSRVCAALGLPTATTAVERFEEQTVLVVERFDRTFGRDGRTLYRRPQEDCCQALGLSSEQKYEADGGPGIERLMALLSGSRDAAADRRRFFKTQVAFWLLAAPDGHAKNFSLFLEPGGRYSLTPIYDVISAWPYLDTGGALSRRNLSLAMGWHGKNRHYRRAEILPRHMRAVARRCDLGAEWTALVEALHDDVVRAVASVGSGLPSGFPERIAGPVLDGLSAAAEALVRG